MSVLKKIGLVMLQVGSVASEIMGFPFISQLLGQAGKGGQIASTVLSDFGAMSQILSLMEVAFPGTGTGSDKLNAAAPVIQQSILVWANSNLPGHNKLKAPATKFAQDVKNLTSAWADIMNDFGN